jgi:hypothetical protein
VGGRRAAGHRLARALAGTRREIARSAKKP